MIYQFLASMPMFVCFTLTCLLMLEYVLHPTRAKRAIAVFMAVATLLYAGHCVYFLHAIRYLPLTDSVYCACNTLVFPLYYLYVKRLTEQHTPWWDILLLCLPALVCGTAVGVVYTMMTDGDVEIFADAYLYGSGVPLQGGVVTVQAGVHTMTKMVFALEIAPILFLGFRRIRHYDRHLHHYYSSFEDKQLTWVKLMFLLFVGTSIIAFVSNVIGRQQFTEQAGLLVVPSTLYSLLLFAIGYVGLKQKGIEELEEKGWNIQDSSFTIGDGDLKATGESLLMTNVLHMEGTEEIVAEFPKTLRERIDQIMREERLYLQPQLKLTDLTGKLNSNRNYVYQAINVEMGMSFAEYVNRMRVSHAIRLMGENPGVPLSIIAEKSGFSSSVSFFRNFKLYKGCSPKQYLARTAVSNP